METEDGFYRRRGYRRKSGDTKANSNFVFPKLSAISATNIAYLYVHCGRQPSDIVAAYPKLVTLADVHLALADYYRNREAFEAEFKKGEAYLGRDALSDTSFSLPSVGLESLVETASKEKS